MSTANIFFEKKALELIKTKLLQQICDYGCGDGSGMKRMAHDLSRNVLFTGIDRFSSFPEENHPQDEENIRFIDHDTDRFTDMENQGGVFDLITCSYALHHFENPVQELQRIANLIASGGYLLLWDFSFASETEAEIMRTIVSFLSEIRTALAGGYHRHHYTLNQALDLFAALDIEVVSSGVERIDIPEEEKQEELKQICELFSKALTSTRERANNPLKKDYFGAAFEFVLENLPKIGIGDVSALFILARKRPVADH